MSYEILLHSLVHHRLRIIFPDRFISRIPCSAPSIDMRCKTFSLLSLHLFSGVLAAPVDPRSTNALEPIYNLYERAVHKIIDRQKQLRNSILDLDPRVEGAYTKQQILIEERGNDVISGYNEGRKEILDLQRNMYPQGGYNFEKDGHIKHLLDATLSLMDAWSIRRTSIFKAGGQQTILELLKKTEAASDNFSAAMIQKAPGWDVIYGNGVKRFTDYADKVSAEMRILIKEYERPVFDAGNIFKRHLAAGN